MIKIATWNVNSIRARLELLIDWVSNAKPDVLLIQEIKTTIDKFPHDEISDLGFNIEVHGQKSYNGVAILSKTPIEDTIYGLPNNTEDDQARYIEATVFGKIRVASIYLPNGNPIGTQKFDYKLRWMDHLHKHVSTSLQSEEIYIFGGDYNVIETDNDVYNPKAFENDALTQQESRSKFKALKNLGLIDAIKVLNDTPHQYSYWDYQGGSWQKDNGLLIDYLLLSPEAADMLNESGIDRNPRGKEKPSDHTPVWCTLNDIN